MSTLFKAPSRCLTTNRSCLQLVINSRLCPPLSRASSHNTEPANDSQRKAIEQFRRSREYHEDYSNLPTESRGMSVFRKAFSNIKPMNVLKDTPLTFANIGVMMQDIKRKMEIQNQQYDEVRYSTLGFDIGAAHFVVYRKGAIKFYGQEKWIRWTTESKYSEVEGLPFKFLDGYVVEAIDMSNIHLHYEALDNFKPLKRLRELSLAGNKLVDDWHLDTLSNLTSLEVLNLQNCPGISHRGLATLYKLDNLKTLLIKNDKAELSQEMKLAVLNLLEFKPELYIDVDPTEREASSGEETRESTAV